MRHKGLRAGFEFTALWLTTNLSCKHENAWETADRYLSGNVRAKLAVAQGSGQIDPAYRRNVEALQAVQPKDLEPGEIEARLGSSWIPPSDIRDFITGLLDVPRGPVGR
jgi:N12 class adenine-specific DNA methylase